MSLLELTNALARFLDAGPEPSSAPRQLVPLLQDAALLALVQAPPLSALEWVPLAEAFLAQAWERELTDEASACLQLAIMAAEAPTAHDNTPEEIAQVVETIDGWIATFEKAGALAAAALGHLVAGHVLLYARDPQGYRSGLLEDAQARFTAVDGMSCPVELLALAKLRTGEASLVALRAVNSARIVEAQGVVYEALELLQEGGDGSRARIAGSIHAQAAAAFGTVGYILSKLPSEHSNQLRQNGMSFLSQALGMGLIATGSERWAKAAWSFALAWLDEAKALAPNASMGVGLDKFTEADERANRVLEAIANQAGEGAPEIRAAQMRLATESAQRPGSDVQANVSRLQSAADVFTESECPEAWSKIQTNLGTILLNDARLRNDADQLERALQHLAAASRIDDPLQDSIRNAALHMAGVLGDLGRWQEAMVEFDCAVDAAEFVVARGMNLQAQRAELGILADILRRAAQGCLRSGRPRDAVARLCRSSEFDFASGVLVQTGDTMPDAEMLDRIQLGQTAVERRWNSHLMFSRTERDLNAIRLQAGRRLEPVVLEAANRWRTIVGDRLARMSFQAQAPPGGALVVPMVSPRAPTFVVVFAGDQERIEAVPARSATRGEFSRVVLGGGTRQGWLSAYLRSADAPAESGSFAGHPAVVGSADGVLSVTFVPGAADDPAETIPQQEWLPALDASTGAAWHLIEPLHRYLADKLPAGAPVLFAGEPLLAMLPLAAVWRHEARVARELVDDWAVGITPAIGVLPDPPVPFSDEADDALLVIPDATGSLPFASWEYAAIAGSRPGKIERLLDRGAGLKRAFMDSIGAYTMHHFSCHARFEHDDPLNSSIDLGDETLTAREIVAELRQVKSKLVVLAACESGMIDTAVTSPDRYVGLATAFLEAGAERVIATLWRVNDISALLLMRAFYRSLREQAPISALRAAQQTVRDMTAGQAVLALQSLIDDASALSPVGNRAGLEATVLRFQQLSPEVRPFQHAYHWAPFVHYGVPQ